MPTLLQDSEVDILAESLDAELTEAEEAYESTRYGQKGVVGDLSYGGTAYGVNVRPTRDKHGGKPRAVARRAWMWDGTESLLPLAWDPEGLNHDGARKYLAKRHCLCCRYAGFKGLQCPNCVRNNCSFCQNSTAPGKVIACFYLSKDKVPFPAKFYGSINCFLLTCPRVGGRGFLSEEEMRLHARSTHRMQYQAHMETLAAANTDEVAVLRKRLDDLIMSGFPRQAGLPALEPVAVGTPEAPLYVPEQKTPKRRRKQVS